MNEALAGTSNIPSSSATGGAVWIILAIVYFSRRRAIGGWLLLFYVQLYLGFAFSALSLPQFFSGLKPGSWNDAVHYIMFFLSVAPLFAIQIIELYAATRLLFLRDEQNVKFLRNTLVALSAAGMVAFVIDLIYFGDFVGLTFDMVTVIYAAIWAWYFSKARRVRSVFMERNWVYI
jgi:hypothetical protein